MVHLDAAAAVAFLCEYLAGLKKGTVAPAFSAIFAYFFESVETHTASAYLLFIASETEYHSTGLPPKSAIFLCLILVEPERANIFTKIY